MNTPLSPDEIKRMIVEVYLGKRVSSDEGIDYGRLADILKTNGVPAAHKSELQTLVHDALIRLACVMGVEVDSESIPKTSDPDKMKLLLAKTFVYKHLLGEGKNLVNMIEHYEAEGYPIEPVEAFRLMIEGLKYYLSAEEKRASTQN